MLEMSKFSSNAQSTKSKILIFSIGFDISATRKGDTCPKVLQGKIISSYHL